MKRMHLIRLATILVLIGIAAVMMYIGRGHTVYIDNKPISYDGVDYPSVYKATVYVDGERIAKLYEKERGTSPCIGQKFGMYVEIMQNKSAEEVGQSIFVTLPYNMDGVVVNLPGLLAGLPPEACISEFVSAVNEAPEEEVVTDEFAMEAEF